MLDYQLRAMAETRPGWRSDREKQAVLGQLLEAQQVYRRLAEEAQR